MENRRSPGRSVVRSVRKSFFKAWTTDFGQIPYQNDIPKMFVLYSFYYYFLTAALREWKNYAINYELITVTINI